MMEDSGDSEKGNHERSLSLIMLVATAILAFTILVIPSKLASQSDLREDRGENGSNKAPNLSSNIPTYSIPLNLEVRMSLSSTHVFKVFLASDKVVEGKVVEGGGSCFVFYVLNEAAYSSYIRSGSSSFAKDGGHVYISATPVHYKMEFTIVPDRTGDYYFVLVNPPGSCHGKMVSIELKS
ncbi:MAG: hypothetical protein ACUVTL_00870 [Thermoproteota archaeon]